MAKKKKKSASQKHRYKVALQVDEIDEHIEALQQRVAQIEDLTREGFPYRDALRPRIELHPSAPPEKAREAENTCRIGKEGHRNDQYRRGRAGRADGCSRQGDQGGGQSAVSR